MREPGATRISEQVRRILLDVGSVGMSDECETLLYMAARAQLVREKIIPALRKGLVVLCDRFLDSTIAYQGYGNGVDIGWIKQLGRFATGGVTPDLTLFLTSTRRKAWDGSAAPKTASSGAVFCTTTGYARDIGLWPGRNPSGSN